MADKEIKITFPDVKMEALEFFLRENNEDVESVLKIHLDKTYEKAVPAQVRKFVESKLASQEAAEQGSAETEAAAGGERTRRGPGRRSRQERNAGQDVQGTEPHVVPDGENAGLLQEEDAGMTMAM